MNGMSALRKGPWVLARPFHHVRLQEVWNQEEGPLLIVLALWSWTPHPPNPEEKFLLFISHPVWAILLWQPHGPMLGFSGVSDGKESACNMGNLGLIPGLGRSSGGGHGNPLQYSCLENSHGQMSLAGYSQWGRKELDVTEEPTKHGLMYISVSYLIALDRTQYKANRRHHGLFSLFHNFIFFFCIDRKSFIIIYFLIFF